MTGRSDPQPNETLDAVGLLCPLPIVETAKRIDGMRTGQILEIRSDDYGILEDMPAWCRGTGHELVGMREEGKLVVCWVRKSG
jgi:tRNA 2-thiouridine synthesizing protein A